MLTVDTRVLWGPSFAGLKGGENRTQSEAAAKKIYEDIVAGRLEPGLKLKPEDLRARYQVGTSTAAL
jgi:DNA-binding GntR family transcriptional regulator